MGIGLAMMYFFSLPDRNFDHMTIANPDPNLPIIPDPVPNPYGSGSPFDFGITSPLETAPGTPLYGLENVGEPIDSPFFLGYSERPKPLDYKPLDLETVLLLGGGL